MKKSKLTNNEHFVPQVYLRYFSINPNGKKHTVWQFDKNNQSFTLMNIRNVCIQNFFYDIKKSEVIEYAKIINDTALLDFDASIIDEEQPVENFFAEVVEGTLFNTLKSIISLYEESKFSVEKLTQLKISDDDLYICSLYSYYQWIRTPKSKQILDKSAGNADKQILEILDSYIGNQKDTLKLREEIKKTSTKLMRKKIHHDIILNSEHTLGMANILHKAYKWIFLYSENHLFLTSDHPALFDPYYERKSFPLFFPLTPNLCICLIDEHDEKHYTKVENGTFIPCNEFNVHSINMLTYSNADRFIISSINKNYNIKETLWN